MAFLDNLRLKLSIRYINKNKKISDKEKKEQIKNIKKLIDEKDYEKRMSMLHDMTCDYLDEIFVKQNACGFKNNICVRRRDMMERGIKKPSYEDGCCHGYKEGKNCHYLGEHGCNIRNVACKLYTCPYLKKRGIKYSINKIYCTRYMLNWSQKVYLMSTFFIPKNEVLPGLIRKRYHV